MCTNYYANSLGHKIASELGKKYIKTSYQQNRESGCQCKSASMSLSSPINKEMHDSTSGKLFGRSKTIRHWAIPLSKDTPPIDNNLVCPRGSEVDFCLRAVSTHCKCLS